MDVDSDLEALPTASIFGNRSKACEGVFMDRRTRFEFNLWAPEAQRSAIRRLALSGLDDDEIAARTGWTAAQVRDLLSPPERPLLMSRVLEKAWRRSHLTRGRTEGINI
jgi:hypothetical protein